MSRMFLLVVSSSSVLGGCVADELVTDSGEQAVISSNGISPNGISPNGISPNGISPNGISPNGVSLNGISPNGISPNGSALASATAEQGAPLSGASLVGSMWTGRLSDGTALPMRVDAATRGTGANADVWSYAISFQRNGERRPLCGVAADGLPIAAISVQGTWNMQQGVPGGGSYSPDAPQFTIACRGSAIAKCVEMGYKTWDGFSDELASCVRALRADYCGDGTPHTVNGTLVNIFDGAGVSADEAAWVPEAEWGPSGARCISRLPNTRAQQVAGTVPSCFQRGVRAIPTCGTGFDAGATLITELAPR